MPNETYRGQKYVPVPAAATTVVKAKAGRLVKIIFTAVAAGTVTFYDDTAAATGDKLYEIDNPTKGQVVEVDMPAKYGIVAVTPAGVTLNAVIS